MKKKYILPLLLPIQWLLLKTLSFFPQTVESVYSNGLYVFISKINRSVLGSIPISVGDVGYTFLGLYCIFWLIRNHKLLWKEKLLSVLSFISVFYFIFHLLWALNYYRIPLHEKLNIRREYSMNQLVSFTNKLIQKTNFIHVKITKNRLIAVANPYSEKEMYALSLKGYQRLAHIFPIFSYSYPSQKESLYSLPLTYMGFGGYLNPFTNEAQVNSKLPRYSYPNVLCHEMAHQIGFGSESECNFIGYLAGISNPDLYFQYSAYANALRYCMGNIAEKDPMTFEQLKSKINPGIRKNFKESEAFWEQYDTFIDKAFHIFYDRYLRSNQQEDGINSYNKFVDLMVNFNFEYLEKTTHE